jgi:hypothetical protein
MILPQTGMEYHPGNLSSEIKVDFLSLFSALCFLDIGSLTGYWRRIEKWM